MNIPQGDAESRIMHHPFIIKHYLNQTMTSLFRTSAQTADDKTAPEITDSTNIQTTQERAASTGRKQYLFTTAVAGRQYYDADDAWGYLQLGSKLRMVHEPDNSQDENAVSLWFDHDGESYKLGYLPRQDNMYIAEMVKMGWGEAFECVISRLDPSESYTKQIGITVKIVRRS